MAQNLPRGTPGRVLILLALLTSVVMVSAWRDALQRSRTVRLRYPTAVGDAAFYTPGSGPLRISSPGGVVELRESAGPRLRRADDRMFRVDLNTGYPFPLYTDREKLAADVDPRLYARVAEGEFVRLRPLLAPTVKGP